MGVKLTITRVSTSKTKPQNEDCYLSQISEKTIVGAMIVEVLIVRAMIVGAMIVRAMIVGAMRPRGDYVLNVQFYILLRSHGILKKMVMESHEKVMEFHSFSDVWWTLWFFYSKQVLLSHINVFSVPMFNFQVNPTVEVCWPPKSNNDRTYVLGSNRT